MITAYRPEVDGLRAVAVISVVIYHLKLWVAGAPLLPGGYLGVDVFFVISGYLITAIIARELKDTGAFSFARFYERRVRRLLPALFAVVVVSLPFAWWVMVPTEFADMAASILASLLFVSNIFFWASTQEYGAQSSTLLPFLHTWSLSVEEQFYLVFPFFMIMYTRYFSKVRYIFPALIVIGFIGATLVSRLDFSFSFYWLPSRGWELLTGSALALAPAPQKTATPGRDWRAVMPALGLALIVLSVAALPLSDLHPGPFTAPTIIGTALIIRYAGGDDLVSRLLKSAPMVLVGLISYSLYLWHYPVFAFGRLHFIEVGAVHMLALMALSFVLAYLSWRFVEQPFRRSQTMSGKRASAILIPTAIAFGSLCVVLVVADRSGETLRATRLADAYANDEIDNTLLGRKSWTLLNARAAGAGFGRSYPKFPSEYEARQNWFTDNPATHKILIIGDSHAKDIYNSIQQNTQDLDRIEVARFGLHATLPKEDVKSLWKAPNLAAADRVFLSFLLGKVTLEKLPDIITRLRAMGKEVVLMTRSPQFHDVGVLPVADYYLRKAPEMSATDIGAIAYTRRATEVDELNQQIEAIATEFDLPLVRKERFICNEAAKACDLFAPDGRKAFYDRYHYTLSGAKVFGSRLIAAYGPRLIVPKAGQPTDAQQAMKEP